MRNLHRFSAPFVQSLTRPNPHFAYSIMTSHTQGSGAKHIFEVAPGGDDTTKQAKQFNKGALDFSDLATSPISQFNTWFSEATSFPIPQAEGCTLSTASLPSGKVSARIVYLKELDDKGFVVYSNWGTSRKAADILSNPNASLVFWWRELERQVRVEGATERLSNEESQIYYDTRIRGSRMGAWASEQSKELHGREELHKRVEDVEKRFEGRDKIPVPDFWGGLRVIPEKIEFWQGRESRLHDRFEYARDDKKESGWQIRRLSP